jgi:hypothetical protein
MASFRLPHLATPEILNAIHPRRLSRFLGPYRAFLTARDIRAPADPDRGPWDTVALARAFLSPAQNTPFALIDALYYVDRLANASGMNALLEATQRAGLAIDRNDDFTPADLAVQVWLDRPDLLERVEAEQFLEHPRSFEYYRVESDRPGNVPDEMALSVDRMNVFESDLNDWFEDHRRGRTVKVFPVDRTDSLWFLIRHGEPFKREESVLGTEPSSVAYRPLKYDVAVYDRRWHELRIHAQLKGQRQLYRRTIGQLVFGMDAEFVAAEKYDLEPLRTLGDRSLVCTDVEGIEQVKLKELQYDWGGPFDAQQVEKATDVFAALRERGGAIPGAPSLIRAVFAVQFRNSKRPRSVTIKVPDKALYQRDADGASVEQWLLKRGFLRTDGHGETQDFDETQDVLGGELGPRERGEADHPVLAGD